MKNKKTHMAILLGLLAGAGSAAFADQVTLNASDDSAALGADPSGNYGGLTFTRIRNQTSADWGQSHVLAKFDLSALPALGAGQSFKVNYARMRFYTTLTSDDASWPNSFPELELYNNTSDWAEGTVTYNTRPTYDAAPVEILDHFGLDGINPVKFTAPDTVSSADWLEFDTLGIAGMVEGWINGTTGNYGVTIKGSASSYTDSSRYFDPLTSEHPTASIHPALIVDYTIIPEPATFGLFGMVGAAMLFVRRKFMI